MVPLSRAKPVQPPQITVKNRYLSDGFDQLKGFYQPGLLGFTGEQHVDTDVRILQFKLVGS